MDAARYIGRVGGLAVALGVGAAVFAGQAIASAAPASHGSSGDASRPSSNSGAANAGPSDAKGVASRAHVARGSTPHADARSHPPTQSDRSRATSANDTPGKESHRSSPHHAHNRT